MAKREPVRLAWPMTSFAGSTVFEMPAVRLGAEVPVGFRLPIDYEAMRRDLRETAKAMWMERVAAKCGSEPLP